MQSYLANTLIIDSANNSIIELAESLTKGLTSDRDKAITLFYFVRDQIKFNPYSPGEQLEYNKASVVLERGHGFCYQKAILLVALARAAGIPARLHFSTIRNHRLSKEFLRRMFGSNILVSHGYAELYLDYKWVGATPAYDRYMCQENGFISTEFDGIHDAKLAPTDLYGQPHIEYLDDHGHFEDFPWDFIIDSHIAFITGLGIDVSEFSRRWETNIGRH